MLLYHSSPAALLPLLPSYLKLIAAYVIRRALGAVLSVVIAHTVTEPYAALQLVQQHALAVLYHGLIVSTLLQVRTYLGHDVRVHRL